MSKLYVNLHPSYTYSNVIISEGYIDELKNYVSLVEWLHWDWYSVRGRPVIQVTGGFSDGENTVDNHLERTKVFLQRIIENGNNDIFVRNSRSDEWVAYKPEQKYSEGQMFDIEVQRIQRQDKAKWLKSDIKKFQNLLKINQNEVLKEALEESIINLRKLEEEEILRQIHLKEVWRGVREIK